MSHCNFSHRFRVFVTFIALFLISTSYAAEFGHYLSPKDLKRFDAHVILPSTTSQVPLSELRKASSKSGHALFYSAGYGVYRLHPDSGFQKVYSGSGVFAKPPDAKPREEIYQALKNGWTRSNHGGVFQYQNVKTGFFHAVYSEEGEMTSRPSWVDPWTGERPSSVDAVPPRVRDINEEREKMKKLRVLSKINGMFRSGTTAAQERLFRSEPIGKQSNPPAAKEEQAKGPETPKGPHSATGPDAVPASHPEKAASKSSASSTSGTPAKAGGPKARKMKRYIA